MLQNEEIINIRSTSETSENIRTMDDFFEFLNETYDASSEVYPALVAYSLPRLCNSDEALVITCRNQSVQKSFEIKYWVGQHKDASVRQGVLSKTADCAACPDAGEPICSKLPDHIKGLKIKKYHIVESLPVDNNLHGHVVISSDKPILQALFLRKLLHKCAQRLFNNMKTENGFSEYEQKTHVPICAYCKKIRQSDGGWVSMEQYFYEKNGYTFTHSICPPCSDEFMMKLNK